MSKYFIHAMLSMDPVYQIKHLSPLLVIKRMITASYSRKWEMPYPIRINGRGRVSYSYL